MKKYNLIFLLSVLLIISCKVSDNSRLAELAKSDQLDRKRNTPEISKNDRARLKEVKTIISEDTLITSNDYFNAAIVLQHGDEPQDYKTANDLAKKAVEIDEGNQKAKILVAQSMDRYLLSINKPQIYGTQRKLLGELEYMQPIDTLQISDFERKQLGLRTIRETLDFFNKMHQKNESNILNYVPNDSLIRIYYPEKRADLIGTFDELLSNINYPPEALKNNISGKVLVEYIITPEGNTKNILVVDGIGYGCDEEAQRIISIAKYKNYLSRDIERRTRIPFEIKN